MNFLSQMDPIYLFVAGCAVAAWVLLRRRGRASRNGRRNADHLEHLHRPTSKWDGAEQDSVAMAERQQVEFHELARDASGRLDSKMILLQQLIAKSQQQIDRLEELLAELNKHGLEAADTPWRGDRE